MRPLAWAIEAVSAALAVQARRVALQRGHAVERHQVLLPQAADAAQLLLVPVDLRLDLEATCSSLPTICWAGRSTCSRSCCLLAFARRAAQLVQPLLALHRPHDFGLRLSRAMADRSER